jgi:hypothetical protein
MKKEYIKENIKKMNDLDDHESIKRFLFKNIYPNLDFHQFSKSNFWYAIALRELDIIYESDHIDFIITDNNQVSKNLWGTQSVGPVG